MKFLDLPPELLQVIVSLLSPKDLCCVRETCSELRDVCDLEAVWTKLSLHQHGVLLPIKDNFTPIAFYQKILHKYAPIIGYWQQMNNGHHGGLFKAYFTDLNTTIKVIKLEPDSRDILKDLNIVELISITWDGGDISIKSDNVKSARVCFPDMDMGLSLEGSHTEGSTDTRKIKMQRVLNPEWISKYHNDH